MLLYDCNSARTREDKTRQLNYLIHWTSFAEKHINQIKHQFKQVRNILDDFMEQKDREKGMNSKKRSLLHGNKNKYMQSLQEQA